MWRRYKCVITGGSGRVSVPFCRQWRTRNGNRSQNPMKNRNHSQSRSRSRSQSHTWSSRQVFVEWSGVFLSCFCWNVRQGRSVV